MAQERNPGKKAAKKAWKKPRSKDKNASHGYQVWSSSGQCYSEVGDNHALCDKDCGWCGHCADKVNF